MSAFEPPVAFRRKGGFMLTLWEIKQNVKNPGRCRKVPTAKYLQDVEEIVASRRIGKEAEVTAYQCGYAVYRIGKYATVFSIHSCGDYLYFSCGKILCIEEHFFDCQEWYVRLVLEGEDRVSRNRESQEQEKNISYSAVSEEWELIADLEKSPLEQIIMQESVGEMLELLTEKQRLIIRQFFFYRKTQKEIAKELGVAAPIISKTISNSIRQIRKKYPDIFQKNVSGSAQVEKGENVYAW